MNSGLPFLLFGAFIVFMVLVMLLSYRQQQRRIAELFDLAQSLGWQFSASNDGSYDSRYSQFSVFCQGDDRYAFNTLTGTLPAADQSCPARMGDYHYQTTSSDGKTTTTQDHHFSYLLVELPYVTLADLLIRHEGFFDKIATAFGFSDINFESAEFSRRFHVKSSDKRFAYDVINPAMMEFLLGSDCPAVEIKDRVCCLTTGHQTWTPEEFRQELNWAGKFFSLWPKYLVSALKTS
jgi:hypothetical protein